MIYSLYIYNRLGECVYFKDWTKKRAPTNPEEAFKLLYGLIFTMKAFISKISPT